MELEGSNSPPGPGPQPNGAFFVAGATRNATRTRRSLGDRIPRLARPSTQRRVFCRRCDTKRDTDPVEPWESSAPPGPEPNATARFLSQVRHETGHGPGGAWGIECSAWPGAQRNGAFSVAPATRNVTRTRRNLGDRIPPLARRPTQRRVFCRRCDTKRDTDPAEPWESSPPPDPAPNATARFLSQVRHETGHGPGGALGIECSQPASPPPCMCLRPQSSTRRSAQARVDLARQMTPLRVNKLSPDSRPNWVFRLHGIQDAVHSQNPRPFAERSRDSLSREKFLSGTASGRVDSLQGKHAVVAMRAGRKPRAASRPTARPFARTLLKASALLIVGHEFQFAPSSRPAYPSTKSRAGSANKSTRLQGPHPRRGGGRVARRCGRGASWRRFL